MQHCLRFYVAYRTIYWKLFCASPFVVFKMLPFIFYRCFHSINQRELLYKTLFKNYYMFDLGISICC